MCADGACEWVVNGEAKRCWRTRLVSLLPMWLLDFPFGTAIAVVALVYGPQALHGDSGSAIEFLPWPYEIIWGALHTLGGLIIAAALLRGRTGTWLPRGLWVCALTMLAYVALVIFGLRFGDYQARTTFSAILGTIALVQAFKMQTGQMWAVAAIRQAEGEGERE